MHLNPSWIDRTFLPFLAFLAFLVWAVPATDEGRDWTGPLIPGGWMAWSFPIALFFFIIVIVASFFLWSRC